MRSEEVTDLRRLGFAGSSSLLSGRLFRCSCTLWVRVGLRIPSIGNHQRVEQSAVSAIIGKKLLELANEVGRRRKERRNLFVDLYVSRVKGRKGKD